MKVESGEHSTGKFAFRFFAISDMGQEREENEDTFVIETEQSLFLVSDGMGGHRGGSLASKIVVEDLSVMIETGLGKLRSTRRRAIRSLLKKTIVEQSRQLRLEGTSEAGYKGMGATIVAVLLKDERAYLANMGDSRLYLYRKGKLTQRSRDHSVVSGLLRQGKISEDEAENHAAQGELTHYLGMDEEPGPFLRTFQLRADDRLLICTDGLTDMLPDADIAAILSQEVDPQAACQALVQAANSAGGDDNITAVVINLADRGHNLNQQQQS